MFEFVRDRLLIRSAVIALTIYVSAGAASKADVIADFTFTPVNPKVGQEVQFTDTSTGNPTNWQWDFDNDGSADSTQQNPTWEFDRAGTFPVTLVVLIPPADIDSIVRNVVVASDPGDLRFTMSSYQANETSGTASIPVRRTGGSVGAVSVRCNTADGSATAPDDYTATMDTLNWLDGDTANKICTIPIINDALDEPDETVGLSLTDFGGGAGMGLPIIATLTIIDDDPPPGPGNLSFTSSSYMVEEDVGAATITVRRTGGSAGIVSVRCDTSNGSATAPDDYMATMETLIWADGDTANKNCTIAIVDDTMEEPDETINLSLTHVMGAGQGSPSTATLTVLANDDPGDVSFTSSSFVLGEDVGTAMITVERTGGSFGIATVRCNTTDGSAVAPDDYTGVVDTLSWADGDTANKICMVPIVNDGEEEEDETLTLSLTDVTGADPGSSTTTTLTILDDDFSLSRRAGLIVPGFEVAVDDPEGTSTLFAVRNTSDDAIDIQVAYYGRAATDLPLRVDFFPLGSRATLSWPVSNDLSDLDVANGIASGLILITEVGEATAPNLEGDYFQIDSGNDFAGGDRLVRPLELCNQLEIRFADFGSGTRLRILVDTPRGDDLPSFTFAAFDEAGTLVDEGSVVTSDHLIVVDVGSVIAQPFGTLLFDFSNSNGGWVSARYSAFGRFSVDLESACRD